MIERNAMRIGGSSRKDGVLFFGDHYVSGVDYSAEEDRYTFCLYEKKGRLKNPAIGVGVGLAGISAASSALMSSESKAARGIGKALAIAQFGALGFYVYKTYGKMDSVRAFHGAEHKAINASQMKAGADVTERETEDASRISRRCGTNLAVYLTASELAVGAIGVGSGPLQSLISMGLGMGLFKARSPQLIPLQSFLNSIGDELQRKCMTAEPNEEQVKAVTRAINLLIAAEEDRLDEATKTHLLDNGKRRPWLIKYVI